MSYELRTIFYNPEYNQRLCDFIAEVYPEFDTKGFTEKIFDEKWDNLSLKERTRHITLTLKDFLPSKYPDALEVLKQVATNWIPKSQKGEDYSNTVFPDFVAVFGLEYPDISIPALAHFTELASSEFGVRPYIVHFPKRMMNTMLEWTKHENHHIRRLASEGCRPRLPWGMALTSFKKDAAPILPILEALKTDPERYVQRSVANNLNDISKDHPELALQIAERWLKEENPITDWVVKHALRGLLKRGNTMALRLFGFGNPEKVEISNLQMEETEIPIGDHTYFSFDLQNNSSKAAKIRLEYGIDFMKSNGKQSRKIFQISERTYEAHETATFRRKQDFKNLTTRKHYAGEHHLAILVNGEEKLKVEFELK